METFSVLLTLFVGKSPVTGEFPAQRTVTWSFDVFFDLRLNKWSKQAWGWWSETPSCSLWRHCNDAGGCGLLCFVMITLSVLIRSMRYLIVASMTLGLSDDCPTGNEVILKHRYVIDPEDGYSLPWQRFTLILNAQIDYVTMFLWKTFQWLLRSQTHVQNRQA